MDEQEIKEVYAEVMKCLDELLLTNDPVAVAGCMLAQSLSVYRTIMDDEEFEILMKGIMDRKDNIRPFSTGPGVLH